MLRKISLSALCLVLLLVGPISMRPAAAVVPTFDAPVFAKMLDELVKTDVLTRQGAAKLYYDIMTYNEVVANGHINVNVIWRQLQPQFKRIDREMAQQSVLQKAAKNVMDQFLRRYPDYHPAISYDELLNTLQQEEHDQLQQIVQETAASHANVAQQGITMDQLANKMKTQKGTVDAINVLGAETNVLEGTLGEIHHMVGNEVTEMQHYVAYQIAHDRTTEQYRQQASQDVTRVLFGQYPDQLNAPVKMPNGQLMPTNPRIPQLAPGTP